ncbi:coronin-1C-A [Lepeophtheirus salmonis]|uniref:Coronin n=1 Tax=Lepeophtheirus salmonis TaxID=72036 RepID=A0A0K2T4T6_LEPSM|nr:coronin-1C-A-like [Lepeophtheirus salmonis]XP_040578677.1 coronin-1C-A-like [Lepeophtheirus salmonis]XP_040578678.1 coronin-1C-A-like [Lepeophtheirus salmonis]
MSFRVVRSSKFRHIYGSNQKREQCYDNIRVSKSSWDSTFCDVNPKFIAVIVESGGGGAFLVLPLSKTGRLSPDAPLVAGHKGPVLDISWCPHNDNVIASASEDCVVKVWHIPDGGLVRTITESVVDLMKHQRRVGLVLWHPSAQNVLLSAGSDNNVIIWNVGTGEALSVFTLPDLVYSGCWNWNGSEVLFTCKDRKIRRVNPRNGEILEEAVAHEGNKASRAIFLKNGLIFTTGFTKHSERQYSLRAPKHLDDPIVMTELDTSNGVMFPMYDPDVNLVYLCGKGDSVIRYFEITPEPPFVHYINTFQTPDPQRGIGMMGKRGVDVGTCEITRFFRLNNNGFCQVIPFTVPRKSELFQEDLYPDTKGDIPAITADEWASGCDSDPILLPMTETGVSTEKTDEPKVRKSNALDKPITRKNSVATLQSNGASTASAEPSQVDMRKLTMAVMEEVHSQITSITAKHKEKIDEQVAEIRKLKAMIVKHESRIGTLETRNRELENAGLRNNNGHCSELLDPDEV